MIGADQPERGPRRPAVRWWPGAFARAEGARRWAFDAALAAAVIAAEVGGSHATTSWGHHPHAAPGIAAYAVLVAGGASLLARRRYPVAVLAVALASALVAMRLGADLVWFALVVAFFTAVMARKRAAALASLVIGYVTSVWPPWRIGQPGQTSVAGALWLAAGLTLMLFVAELIRIRSQRAAALARSREEELRRLASEERIRMARDLHDVVAHNISVINVQANTALHLMDRQPERARSALTAINDVSKQALIELRSVLGVLRDVDAHGVAAQAPRAPAPGLARLGDLIENAAAAGLTVRVQEDGRRVPLPAEVGHNPPPFPRIGRVSTLRERWKHQSDFVADVLRFGLWASHYPAAHQSEIADAKDEVIRGPDPVRGVHRLCYWAMTSLLATPMFRLGLIAAAEAEGDPLIGEAISGRHGENSPVWKDFYEEVLRSRGLRTGPGSRSMTA